MPVGDETDLSDLFLSMILLSGLDSACFRSGLGSGIVSVRRSNGRFRLIGGGVGGILRLKIR